LSANSPTLEERIKRHIKLAGPMPLAEFLQWVMGDPNQGYYASRQAIGSKGDFITAPEISQMFGELIGTWVIARWLAMGRPDPFSLVELGPGRGSLMADCLRALKTLPDCRRASRVFLVETSEKMRAVQKQSLEHEEQLNWLEDMSGIPQNPAIVIGNEFLDVLPIRQFVKQNGSWLERVVALDQDSNLCFGVSDMGLHGNELPHGADSEPDGAVLEISSMREAWLTQLCDTLKVRTGCALLIDYGYLEPALGDTLQAARNHKFVEILQSPGTADITSHVDFFSLMAIAKMEGMATAPLQTQGAFLLGMGLLERAGQLGASADEASRHRISSEAERLALPHEMGGLFKVFTVASQDAYLLDPVYEDVTLP